jgi:hypothetical protein
MDLSQYDLKPSLNPIISNSLQPLIDMLNEEWELWLVKPNTNVVDKTLNTISECKRTLLIFQNFITEDNWKGAYLTMKRKNFNVADLKSCFRNNKDNQQKALKIYKNAMLNIINWIKLNSTD